MCIRDRCIEGDKLNQKKILENIIEESIVDYIVEKVIEKIMNKSKRGLLLFTGATIGYGPVSYTHLDVYKRQSV